MPENKLFTDLYRDKNIHVFARVKYALEEISNKYDINDTDGLYELILKDKKTAEGIPYKIHLIPNVGYVTWTEICRILIGYGYIIFDRKTENPIEQNEEEECEYIAVKDFVFFPSMFGQVPFYIRPSLIKKVTILKNEVSDERFLIQGHDGGEFFVTEEEAEFVMGQIEDCG